MRPIVIVKISGNPILLSLASSIHFRLAINIARLSTLKVGVGFCPAISIPFFCLLSATAVAASTRIPDCCSKSYYFFCGEFQAIFGTMISPSPPSEIRLESWLEENVLFPNFGQGKTDLTTLDWRFQKWLRKELPSWDWPAQLEYEGSFVCICRISFSELGSK